MNEIQTFTSEQFGEVRTVKIEGEPWFVAADVCKALEIGNPTMALSRLDSDEKNTLNSTEGIQKRGRGNPLVNIINEPGLYTLVLSSRKPEAKLFKRWITHEVIPTIRKTGGYVDSGDKFFEKYMPGATEQMKQLFIENWKTINQLTIKIEADKPKVEFADAVTATDDLISVGDMAQLLSDNGINIGRNRLFEWFRKNKMLRKNNSPYQRYVNEGIFKVKEHTSGEYKYPHIYRVTYLTGKGQRWVTSKLRQALPELAAQ